MGSFRSITSLLRRFANLPSRRRYLVLEAVLALSVARVAINLFPFRLIAKALGKQGEEAPQTLTGTRTNVVKDVSWAIRTVNRRRPFRQQCLVSAVAAQTMLRLHKIPSTFSLGIAKDGARSLEAHAWVTSGGLEVAEFGRRERFNVLSTFAYRGSVDDQGSPISEDDAEPTVEEKSMPPAREEEVRSIFLLGKRADSKKSR
jgi:hypothetical protein